MDSQHARARLERELESGEELLWCGTPDVAQAATSRLGQSIAGVVVTAFALFWTSGAFWMTQQGARMGGNRPPLDGLFPFFGLIFVGFGLWLIFSPVASANKAQNTVYGATNRRLLIVTDSEIQSFLPAYLERVIRREHANGRGDVIFARSIRYAHNNGHRRAYEVEIGFFGIENARDVEKIARDLRGQN